MCLGNGESPISCWVHTFDDNQFSAKFGALINLIYNFVIFNDFRILTFYYGPEMTFNIILLMLRYFRASKLNVVVFLCVCGVIALWLAVHCKKMMTMVQVLCDAIFLLPNITLLIYHYIIYLNYPNLHCTLKYL